MNQPVIGRYGNILATTARMRRPDEGATSHAAMDTERRMTWLLRTSALLLGLCACATGEIRCYCNDASCVRTGYMCKSAMGRCFSQLTYERDSTRSVHGCAESLPVDERHLCEGTGNIAEGKTGERVQWPILLCCKEEMCNYMDSLDINIYLTKSNGTKDSSWPTSDDERREEVVIPGGGGSPPYVIDTSPNELWFKAAVIAVPIAGGFILVLLVVLAIRVLKNDSRRHRQLMRVRHDRSLTKAQLYVADHFYQNELLADPLPVKSDACFRRPDPDRVLTSSSTLAAGATSAAAAAAAAAASGGGGRNQSNVTRSSIKDSRSVRTNPARAGGAPYRDVHIRLDHSRSGYEKMAPPSDGSAFDDSYDSVLVWGDPAQVHDAASV